MVINSTPTAGGVWGWQNTVAGTPGTWTPLVFAGSGFTGTGSGLCTFNVAGGLTTNISGCQAGLVQLSGATGTITGTSLTSSCDSGTATVAGAVAGHTVGVSTTDGTDVGGAFYLRASVTSTNTVTVYVCGTGTPPSKAYNVTTY